MMIPLDLDLNNENLKNVAFTKKENLMDIVMAILTGVWYLFLTGVLLGGLVFYAVLALHTRTDISILFERAVRMPNELSQDQKDSFVRSLRFGVQKMFVVKAFLMIMVASIFYVFGRAFSFDFLLLVSFLCLCLAVANFYRYLQMKTALVV